MNTYKQFLFAFCFLLYTTNVTAQKVLQEYRQLSLGYGISSNLKHTRPGVLVGPFIATYQFALGKRITMGVAAGCAFEKTDPFTFTYRDRAGNTIIVNNEVLRYSSYMGSFRTDFHYLKKEKIDIYSGLNVDIGPSFQKLQFATQFNSWLLDLSAGVNLFGCRYRVTQRMSVYGEVGLKRWGQGIVGVSTILGKIVEKDNATQSEKK